MRRARSLALAFATVTVLAGCAGAPSSPGQPDSAPPASTTEATSPGAGQAAPAPVVPEQLRFAARTLDGKEFSGQSLAGKAAVLWFWAPWCPKCQREAPTVAGAAQANAGKVEFIGVAAQDELAAMQGFVSEYQVGSFPHLADLDASIWRRFDVTYQPAYAFISPDGSIEVVKDQLSEPELADRIRQLTAS
ncbi:MAG: redoxin domain-containing protein [Pseudonocardiaceae bacterium]